MTYTIKDISEKINVPYSSLLYRLTRSEIKPKMKFNREHRYTYRQLNLIKKMMEDNPIIELKKTSQKIMDRHFPNENGTFVYLPSSINFSNEETIGTRIDNLIENSPNKSVIIERLEAFLKMNR